ncbi:LuxR C-terminal-related transcriptional regulator [Galbibacter sp. EGI 63066]|uniref:LuxR C-terminal-related transcriptional regulator n=1 Tax=Galbibacter sp. EGI 63066 TaxID=2993559 RepID=UPI0022490BB3|nr:LuxR C-terminal-related transcriptional regulator [Galbibacter sp. EGI 63066]MCX2682067.1 LuxR C-terminal-related transcriptional regulator [Galbibacter sp. EGI 63066]
MRTKLKRACTIGKLLLLSYLFTSCSTHSEVDFHFFNDNDALIANNNWATKYLYHQKTTRFINNGIENGLYYLYFPADSVPYTLQFASQHITVESAIQGKDTLKNTGQLRYPVYKLSGNSPAWFKINCQKEGYIPVWYYPGNSFYKAQSHEVLIIGLYYGLAVTVILFNLLFYLITKEVSFFYYSLFTLSISLALWYTDGMFQFMAMPAWFIHYFEIVLHPLVALSGGFFAINFLHLKNYIPHIRLIGWIIWAPLPVLSVLYLLTGHSFCFLLLEAYTLAVLTFYWLLGVIYTKKLFYARLFVAAYFLILILAIDFYLAKLLGFQFMDIEPGTLKLGGVFEMSLLTYTVYYRMNKIKAEVAGMKQQIAKYVKEIMLLQSNSDPSKNIETSFIWADLSHREREVAKLVAKGKTNQEIANELFVSKNTVKYHIKNIFDKLGIQSRKKLTLAANGLQPTKESARPTK